MNCGANSLKMGKPKIEPTVSTKKLVSECLKTNRKAEQKRDRLIKEQQKELERKQKLAEKDTVTAQPSENGPFMQFQLKKGMRIAPTHRVTLSQLEAKRANLDRLFLSHPSDSTSLTASSLGLTKFGRTDFLHELRTRQHTPLSYPATWPTEPPDVQFLGDSVSLPLQRTLLRRPGTGGTGGTVWLRAKFLQFVENYRPAYYGTWRRRSYVVTGRRPFSKDIVELDYTVDSDDEWEEDEPGESITQSDNEEDEKEDEDENEEEEDDHFFVPHGYLSDDEGVSAEEPVDADEAGQSEEAKRLRRRLSCIEYEEAHKRGLQRLKRFLWGPVWSLDDCLRAGTTSVNPVTNPRSLGGEQDEDKENVEFFCQVNSERSNFAPEAEARLDASVACDPLSVYRVHVWENHLPIPVSLDVVEPTKTVPRRVKKSLPDEAIPYFIQLVHKSPLNKRKLAFEFRVFWHRHTTGRLPECTSYEQFKRHMSSSSGQTSTTSSKTKTCPSHSLLSDGLALSQTLLIAKLNEVAVFEDGRWSVHPRVLRQFSKQLSPLLENQTGQPIHEMDDLEVTAITLTPWSYLSDIREITKSVRRQSLSKKHQPPQDVDAAGDKQTPTLLGPLEGDPPANVSALADISNITTGRTPMVKATPKRHRPRSVVAPSTPDLSLGGKLESPVSGVVVETLTETTKVLIANTPEQSTASVGGSGSTKKRLTLDNFFTPPSPKRTNRSKSRETLAQIATTSPADESITIDSD